MCISLHVHLSCSVPYITYLWHSIHSHIHIHRYVYTLSMHPSHTHMCVPVALRGQLLQQMQQMLQGHPVLAHQVHRLRQHALPVGLFLEVFDNMGNSVCGECGGVGEREVGTCLYLKW